MEHCVSIVFTDAVCEQTQITSQLTEETQSSLLYINYLENMREDKSLEASVSHQEGVPCLCHHGSIF